MSKPWERQRGPDGKPESGEAFEAWTIYRDLGADRSLESVSQKLGKSKALLERWSSRWGWVERSRAWDDYVDVRKREALVKEREAMARRHMLQARVAGDALMTPVASALQRIKNAEGGKQLEQMDLAALLKLAFIGARSVGKAQEAERRAIGVLVEDAENVAEQASEQLPPDDIPDELLADPDVARLAQKLASRHEGKPGGNGEDS